MKFDVIDATGTETTGAEGQFDKLKANGHTLIIRGIGIENDIEVGKGLSGVALKADVLDLDDASGKPKLYKDVLLFGAAWTSTVAPGAEVNYRKNGKPASFKSQGDLAWHALDVQKRHGAEGVVFARVEGKDLDSDRPYAVPRPLVRFGTFAQPNDRVIAFAQANQDPFGLKNSQAAAPVADVQQATDDNPWGE